jgi:ribosome-associated protein
MTGEVSQSRTQRKREMTALQDLGAELVLLNAAQLQEMALPESLHEAVIAAQRMTRFEARRRQLQYIGKLMRQVDPVPIRAHLERWRASSHEHTAQLHRVERWRERLLADEAALSELAREHPHADLQQLRALVRNSKREQERNLPPRSYRALFKLLRETLVSASSGYTPAP